MKHFQADDIQSCLLYVEEVATEVHFQHSISVVAIFACNICKLLDMTHNADCVYRTGDGIKKLNFNSLVLVETDCISLLLYSIRS